MAIQRKACVTNRRGHSVNSHNIKISLEDFNARVGREDIFKPTVRNKNLHKTNNDNGSANSRKLFHVKNTNRQTEIHTTEPSVPENSSSELLKS